MSDESPAEVRDDLSLMFKLTVPNELDDFIGKVVREGAYLEDVLRECVAILGGLGNDVDVLLMGQSWDWLYSMAVELQKESGYATRRCNDDALPGIGEALSEANGLWKQRNGIVHGSWMICPALRGRECKVAASNGGKVGADEYHVARSVRRKFERQVEHRRIYEIEGLVEDFERVRNSLIEGLEAFDPKHFR